MCRIVEVFTSPALDKESDIVGGRMQRPHKKSLSQLRIESPMDGRNHYDIGRAGCVLCCRVASQTTNLLSNHSTELSFLRLGSLFRHFND